MTASNAVAERSRYDQQQLQQLIKGENKALHQVRRDLSNTVEFEEVLMDCYVNICQYRLKIEKYKDRYRSDIAEMFDKSNFHFFMCYRGNYYARIDNPKTFDSKTVVEYHQEVIEKYGYCWWAKFYSRRLPNGTYELLEPFGESMKIEDKEIPATIRNVVQKRVDNSKPVYLFNYSPNLPNIELVVCNVTEFYFCNKQIPYQARINGGSPECAYMPSYYFAKRKSDCLGCKEIDPKECILQFPTHFWFKIDKIQIVDEDCISKEFMNLKNCFSKDFINFAIPIFYPLLVYQDNEKHYFQHLGIFHNLEFNRQAKSVLHKSGMDKRIIKELKAIDEKISLTPGANMQKFHQKGDNRYEIRFSDKGRIFFIYRKGRKPLVVEIDPDHKHKG